MKPGDTITLQYWPKDKPLPKGAKIVSRFERQTHSRYSVLIQLPETKNDR